MYVYMYACMHACCMHICMDVRMFLHMPTQKHNYKRTTMGHHLHLQKKKVMYYYTQTPNLRSAAPCAPTARLNFPATPALVSLWLHCIYIYIYIFIYICKCTYIYTCPSLYIYILIYMQTYMGQALHLRVLNL